jgi:RND family efflux transporter MFP subunit
MDIEKVKKLRLEQPSGEELPRSESTAVFTRLIFPLLMAAIGFAAGWILRPVIFPAAAEVQASAAVSGPTRDTGSGRTFTSAGYVEPAPPFPVRVTPMVLGRLELFEVLEGMEVEKGQTIARLDSTALERQASELEAALGVNAARIEHARSVAARAERLTAIGSVSRREEEQARAEWAVLEAERKRLDEELASLRWKIDHTEIRSPVHGVVFERLAQSGQWVGPGHESAIASIYDPARLQVWADINQRDAARVRAGQGVEVSVEAEPGRVFRGRVGRILPRASIAKNTFQAKIVLDETSASLRPDMSVKVTFLGEAEPAATPHRDLEP